MYHSPSVTPVRLGSDSDGGRLVVVAESRRGRGDATVDARALQQHQAAGPVVGAGLVLGHPAPELAEDQRRDAVGDAVRVLGRRALEVALERGERARELAKL